MLVRMLLRRYDLTLMALPPIAADSGMAGIVKLLLLLLSLLTQSRGGVGLSHYTARIGLVFV